MAIKLIGTSSGAEQDVDATPKAARVILYDATGVPVDVDTDHNLQVSIRPPAFDSLGAYSVAQVTGNIAATLAAGSTLFSARWGDATRFGMLEWIRASAAVVTAVTTGVIFDLEAIIARSFTASDTGGTPINLAAPFQKRRVSMGASLFTDMRIATTGTLTPGTRTPDAQAIGRLQGFTGTALGTKIFDSNPQYLYRREDPNEHPVILAQNEGILIRNPLVGPATGTFAVLIEMGWMEVSSY